jgi:hypothetical protein
MTWEAFRSVAAMGSFFVALAALLISWSVWRTNRNTDLTRTVKDGDEKLSKRLDTMQEVQSQSQREIKVQVAQLEASFEHGISRDDIDKVHLRVNGISREISQLSGELQALSKLIERMDTYMRQQK